MADPCVTDGGQTFHILDLVAVHDIRWDIGGSETADDYIFF